MFSINRFINYFRKLITINSSSTISFIAIFSLNLFYLRYLREDLFIFFEIRSLKISLKLLISLSRVYIREFKEFKVRIYYDNSSKSFNSNKYCDDSSKSSNFDKYCDDSSKSSNSSNKNIELFSTTKEIYTSSSNKDIKLFFKLFEISLILLSPLILTSLLSS